LARAMKCAVLDARSLLRARWCDPVHKPRTLHYAVDVSPTRTGPGVVRGPQAPANRGERRSCRRHGRDPLIEAPLTARSRSLRGSAGCDRCVEQVCGSLPAERLARSLVDLDSDPRDVLHGVHGQVGTG